jgi:hypothetical protein
MGRATADTDIMGPVEPTAAHVPARLRARDWLLSRPKVGDPSILGRRSQKELSRHTIPEEEILFCLRGDLAHALIALNDRLIILKTGFHAGTTFGSLVTTIFYCDVTGIQMHTHLLSGWIEVSSPSFQGRERKHARQPRWSDRDVYKLPNCVPIHKWYAAQYQPALAVLRGRVAAAKDGAELPQSIVGELERLATLHQAGSLSDEEFARAKNLLLAVPVPSQAA